LLGEWAADTQVDDVRWPHLKDVAHAASTDAIQQLSVFVTSDPALSVGTDGLRSSWR
jgi:hypothetical protein